MEVFAATAQAMDYSIGKVIDHLKNTGEYNNTLIIFTSDNGAEAEDVYDLKLREDIVQEVNQFITTQNNSESNLGNANSLISYGPGWAEASNTPFKGFKGFLTEGGIKVPFILKTPGDSEYKVENSLTFVSDIVPTLLDYTNSTYPNVLENGIEPEPLAGKSLKPILENQSSTIYNDNEFVPLEYFGNKAVYKGNWKALNLITPFGGDNTWNLYDIEKDPSETNNLASEEPELLNEMINAYNSFANNTNIIPPDYATSDISISDEISVTG
jgi:arylsulfatase